MIGCKEKYQGSGKKEGGNRKLRGGGEVVKTVEKKKQRTSVWLVPEKTYFLIVEYVENMERSRK